MKRQVLTPAVKHGKEPDLGTQVLRIGSYCLQSLRRGLEEDGVNQSLVLVADNGDLFRHRKHYMEIGNVQQLGLAVLDPFRASQLLAFGAMAIRA
jgi:hypothetical protein